MQSPKHSVTLGRKTNFVTVSPIFWHPYPLWFQALMRTLLRSARPSHQLPRKREKRRERKGSWRSRRCWFSTWKTQRHLLCKWKEQSLSLTPCYTGKPLQVQQGVHLLLGLMFFFDILTFSLKIFESSCPGGCAVLCDSTWVQCCQLGQWSSEDVAFGLVDRCCN